MTTPDKTITLAVRYVLVIFFESVFLFFIAGSATAASYDDFNDGTLDESKCDSDESPNTTVNETNGRLELSISPAPTGFFGTEIVSKRSVSGAPVFLGS
jgi:hypothetical protein